MVVFQLSDFYMATFIIGSRINPIFPNIQPTSIIGINGAIDQINRKYGDIKNVTMVCSPHIFLEDFKVFKKIYYLDQDIDINFLESVKKKILSKKLREIILRPLSDPQYYKEIRKISMDDSVIKKNCINYLRHTNYNYEKFILQSFKMNYFNFLFKEIFYKKSVNFKDYIRCLFKKNFFILKPFKISTGILGLMTAINNPLHKPPYYVIGIGIDASGYEYDSKRKTLRKNHLYADINYLKTLSQIDSLSGKIFFTNKELDIEFKNFKKNKG